MNIEFISVHPRNDVGYIFDTMNDRIFVIRNWVEIEELVLLAVKYIHVTRVVATNTIGFMLNIVI